MEYSDSAGWVMYALMPPSPYHYRSYSSLLGDVISQENPTKSGGGGASAWNSACLPPSFLPVLSAAYAYPLHLAGIRGFNGRLESLLDLDHMNNGSAAFSIPGLVWTSCRSGLTFVAAERYTHLNGSLGRRCFSHNNGLFMGFI